MHYRYNSTQELRYKVPKHGQTDRQTAPRLYTGVAMAKNNDAPQSLPLQMVERLLRAQPDSLADHVTACVISKNVSNA